MSERKKYIDHSRQPSESQVNEQELLSDALSLFSMMLYAFFIFINEYGIGYSSHCNRIEGSRSMT